MAKINHFGIYEQLNNNWDPLGPPILKYCVQGLRTALTRGSILLYLPINALKFAGNYDYNKLNIVINFINSLVFNNCSILGEEDVRAVMRNRHGNEYTDSVTTKCVVILVNSNDNIRYNAIITSYLPLTILRPLYSSVNNHIINNILHFSGNKVFDSFTNLEKLWIVCYTPIENRFDDYFLYDSYWGPMAKKILAPAYLLQPLKRNSKMDINRDNLNGCCNNNILSACSMTSGELQEQFSKLTIDEYLSFVINNVWEK